VSAECGRRVRVESNFARRGARFEFGPGPTWLSDYQPRRGLRRLPCSQYPQLACRQSHWLTGRQSNGRTGRQSHRLTGRQCRGFAGRQLHRIAGRQTQRSTGRLSRWLTGRQSHRLTGRQSPRRTWCQSQGSRAVSPLAHRPSDSPGPRVDGPGVRRPACPLASGLPIPRTLGPSGLPARRSSDPLASWASGPRARGPLPSGSRAFDRVGLPSARVFRRRPERGRGSFASA